MTDHEHKIDFRYARLSIDFTGKAAELCRILAAQSRMVKALSRAKQTPEVKALIVSVAEGYDVSNDLLTWTRDVLQEVAKDEQALTEGSQVRERLKWAQEFNAQLLDREDQALKDKILSLKA